MDGIDALERVFNDAEIFETQEVEFEQPQIFNTVHFILRHNGLVVLRGMLQRHKIAQGFRRNDNSARMR